MALPPPPLLLLAISPIAISFEITAGQPTGATRRIPVGGWRF
jgi:hypothetical protein